MASADSQSYFVSLWWLSNPGIGVDAVGGAELRGMPLIPCEILCSSTLPLLVVSVWRLEIPRGVTVGHDLHLRAL